MSDNLIREKHLTSLGSAVKHYVDNNFSSGSCVLDSVPATVNGSLWYELQNDSPVIKFYQGGHSFSLSPTMDISDPQLTLSPAEQTISSGEATINVSYLGDGTISVNSSASRESPPTYDATNKTITMPYSSMIASTYGTDEVTVSVSLSAGTGYYSTTASAVVHMPDSGGPFNPDDPDVEPIGPV